MATASMDTSEVEYLKSCRDKLRDISDILKDKSDEKELSIEEKLKEIKKILICGFYFFRVWYKHAKEKFS